MIMSVIPERPYSADSATRAMKEYVKEIDYYQSFMHGEAIVRRNTLKERKNKRGASIGDSIVERNEADEEDKNHLSLKGSIGNPFGSITLSKMDLNHPQGEKLALSAIESKYLVSVLKNRSVQAFNVVEK